MRRLLWLNVVAVAAVALLHAGPVLGDLVLLTTYQGILSTDVDLDPDLKELTGTQSWAQNTTIEYLVKGYDSSGNGAANFYTYQYTLTAPAKDVSHFILETSDTFTKANILNGIVKINDEPFTKYFVNSTAENDQQWGPSPSNPGIPGSIPGIKFDELSGTSVTVWFESNRDPIWGNFYAVDGKENDEFVYLYNTKFAGDLGSDDYYGKQPTSSDFVGGVAISGIGFVLVPNSGGDLDVPHPGALVGLLSMGGIALVRRFRRRRSLA